MKAFGKLQVVSSRSIKDKINAKKMELKLKLSKRIESLNDMILGKYIIPYVNEYLRQLIIAKGLNPDATPKPKVSADEIIVKTNNNRSNSMSFNHYVPSWVSESFTDPTKHPLYSAYKRPLPVVVEEEETNLPFWADSQQTVGESAIENIRRAAEAVEVVLNDVKDVDAEDLKTVEGRSALRLRAICAANAELEKNKKKSIKRKPVKTKDLEMPVVTQPQPIKVTKTFKKGSFRRVSDK